ncbi:MAG: FAD-dependent oxidoreductase [Rhodospirillales bacterium]
MTDPETKIAVIGAGIAGLSCAAALTASGYDVHVFDKGRTPGGRISTRRNEQGLFNHGAQFFTARDPDFVSATNHWKTKGLITELAEQPAELGQSGDRPPAAARYTGVPAINDLAGSMARGLSVRCDVEIARVERTGDKWLLSDQTGKTAGLFDHLAVAIPAPQAAILCAGVDPIREAAESAAYAPCWAALFTTQTPVITSWSNAFIADPVLSWAARQQTGNAQNGFVLHATAEWSAENLELERPVAASRLVEAFQRLLNTGIKTDYLRGHRWRYARVTKALGQDCLYLKDRQIGVCGDWLRGPRVEEAWLSGRALAAAILANG